MILVRLTYYSRNRLDRPDAEAACVCDILAQSIGNNRRDGVTGAFVYNDRWFAQELEGVEAAVSATFERILRDSRHSNVTLVTMQPIPERRYASIAMAAIARRADNDDLFHHYCSGECFDPRLMRADRISDLIEAVVDRRLKGERSWTTRNTKKIA